MASQATPVRRTSSFHDPSLTSPPLVSRRASSVISLSSSIGPTSPSVGTATGSERKRRTRNLLQNYRNLAEGTAKTAGGGDPMDLDSPGSFNPDLYFNHISSTASLPSLLKRENELLTEIRELDGERQSLVYNHHHELIEASDTIRKMKSRAEALDASLDSLKSSFQSISQLSASLAPSSSSASDSAYSDTRTTPRAPSTGNGRRLSILPEDPPSPTKSVNAPPMAVDSMAPAAAGSFDPLVHLPALLSLPILLRALLVHDRARADSLWGLWEPALRSWEDEDVEGVKVIGMECREALRGRRRSSLSASKTASGVGDAGVE